MEIELTDDLMIRLQDKGIISFDKDGYRVDNDRFCKLVEIGLDKLDRLEWENENNG